MTMRRSAQLLLILSIFVCCETPISLERVEPPNEVLKFENTHSLLDYISNEKHNTQNGRVKTTGQFVSFNDVYLTAIKELNEVDDAIKQDSILKKYQDVIELKDSVLKAIIPLGAYSKICNRQRIYQTGDFINKVVSDNYLITTHESNYHQLLTINSIDDVEGEEFQVIKYAQEWESNSASRINANCGKTILVDYFKNANRCKDDRRVWIHAKAYFVYFGDNMYLPYSDIRVWGEKRNGLCVWSPYETTLKYRNVSFSLLSFALDNPNWGWTTPQNAIRSLFAVAVPDYYGTSDILAIDVFKGPTGAWLNMDNYSANTIIAQMNPAYEFYSIRIEAASRGTDNNWAVINCQ